MTTDLTTNRLTPSLDKIQELRQKLGPRVKEDFAVKPKEGIPTAHPELNQYLLWGGFPKRAMSCVLGLPGLGATSLWSGAAAQLTRDKKWVAWLGTSPRLFPLTLQTQGVDLSYLWVTSHPFEERTWLWVLQELLQSDLFDLIGCDLDENSFSLRSWQKLQRFSRSSPSAMVFLSRKNKLSKNLPLFSLAVELNQKSLRVHRALHRPSPYQLPRRNLYAHLMPQLTETGPKRNRRGLSQIQSPRSIPNSTERGLQ